MVIACIVIASTVTLYPLPRSQHVPMLRLDAQVPVQSSRDFEWHTSPAYGRALPGPCRLLPGIPLVLVSGCRGLRASLRYMLRRYLRLEFCGRCALES